ncbi:hypothetical protein Sste5346_007301 [Sporothrix stenoceras]|uniref:Heterokaryon incompatibility domain-containing protein n=1 Tax=Sporothrix stenoceras TaxID=5173 RepID=A0ABR3YVP9_9PEZI
MKLLDCLTKQIVEFVQDVPKYAILSHTWEDGELTFALITQAKDALRKGKSCDVTKRQGWPKIHWACEQALKDNIYYLWVDTVCIDKTSSAELSEAINSMYAYYRKAAVCYVYMYDVCNGTSLLSTPGHGACSTNRVVPFEKSRWFLRGWTLQELIAPQNMSFFDHHWNEITTKKKSLPLLAKITGIDELILDGGNLRLVSIARIMSWAARRTTTREEDMAYSLLGLFGISMPMLYGEGSEAFLRLQKVLIETYNDQTIFAWEFPPANTLEWDGVLAPSPRVFLNSANMSPHQYSYVSPKMSWKVKPTTITSRGVFFNSCVFATRTILELPSLQGIIMLGCVDMAQRSSMQPSSLITIDVEFTDNTRQSCIRRRNTPLRMRSGRSLDEVHDVYTKASGSYAVWDLSTDKHCIVQICTLPKWPPKHSYTRIFPTAAAHDQPPGLQVVVPDCAFIVYRQNSNSARRVPTDDEIQHKISHLVIYLVHKAHLGLASDYDLELASSGTTPTGLAVAVRSYEGYAAVLNSINELGSDLTYRELSSRAVEHQRPGLRLNANLDVSDLDGSYCLDLFAHPCDESAEVKYSRREEWRTEPMP